MPSVTKRASGNDIRRNQWSIMVMVLSNVMEQTAELLFPADSKKLLLDVCTQIVAPDEKVQQEWDSLTVWCIASSV